MAAENSTDNADYRDHKETYESVCTLFKVSIIFIVITLLLLAAFVV